MPDMPQECALISGLFPEYVRLSCMRVQDVDCDVFEAEQALIKKAVAKRRREFAAGRCCARWALAKLGCEAGPILHDENGAPQWPQGIAGSITHTSTYAAAAVAQDCRLRGIGIDMETVSRISPAIADKILTEPEKKAVQQEASGQPLLALFFSAKESVYKCLHPILQCRISFADACIDYNPGHNTLKISLSDRIQSAFPPSKHLRGRYRYFNNTVCTAVWLEANS